MNPHTNASIIRAFVSGGEHSSFIFLSTFFKNSFVSCV